MISLIFLNLPSIHFSLMYDPQDSNYKKLLANPYIYLIFGCTVKCTQPGWRQKNLLIGPIHLLVERNLLSFSI